MMDYQEFKKVLIDEFEMQIYQQGLEYKLDFQDVVKNNGVSLDGIVLRGESNIAPVVYAEQYYQDYEGGRNVHDMVRETLQNLEQNAIMQDFDERHSTDWAEVKEKVIFQLIGGEENWSRQEELPCRQEADLILTYRVLLEVDSDCTASYVVTNELQKRMGVTEDQLYQAALSNTPQILPPVFQNMEDTIVNMMFGDLPGEDGDLDEMLAKMEKSDGMYILSNNQKWYGAVVALYPEVMDKIAQAFDRDMVVLPSAVHELILMPYLPEMDLAEAKAMVSDINREQVSPEEVLANQVYVYDKADRKLMIGEEWERQKVKEQGRPKKTLRETLKEKQGQVAIVPPIRENGTGKDMER